MRIILLFALFLFIALTNAKICTKRRKCNPVKRCKNVTVRKQYQIVVPAWRTVRKFKYVRVPIRRRICYMKKVQKSVSYLVYYRKVVKVRVAYLKKVSYRVRQRYRSKAKRPFKVRYRSYYWTRVKRVKKVPVKVTRYYWKLVTVRKRCKKPYWYYFWTTVRKSYKGTCKRRKYYLKPIRYRSTCPYKKKQCWLTNIMVKNGNCYKRKRKCRLVTRFKPCWKTKLVRRWRWQKYTCTKWRNVRVRRRKLKYRLGWFCTKKVKKRFSRRVTIFVPRPYWVKVRRWRWATKTVWRWVPVWRWKWVRKTKYVVKYKLVNRTVRRVKRVWKKVWTTVPAWRYVRYTTRKLVGYNVRQRYGKRVTRWRRYTKRVCFRTLSCYTVRRCF